MLDVPHFFGLKNLQQDMSLDDMTGKLATFIPGEKNSKKIAMLIEGIVRRLGYGDAEIPVHLVVLLMDGVEAFIASQSDDNLQKELVAQISSVVRLFCSRYPQDDFYLLQRISLTIGDENTKLLAETSFFRSLVTVRMCHSINNLNFRKVDSPVDFHPSSCLSLFRRSIARDLIKFLS